jgi:hypothetical protein
MQHDKVQARVNKYLVTDWLCPLWQVQNQNSKFVVTPHCNTWCTILKLCDHPSFSTLLTNRANKHEIKQNEMRLWWNIIVRHQAGNSSLFAAHVTENKCFLGNFGKWNLQSECPIFSVWAILLFVCWTQSLLYKINLIPGQGKWLHYV